MQYKAIEVIPEGFTAVINSTGKVYHFTVLTNRASILWLHKWGERSMSEIINEIGQNAFIGTMAFWLLTKEDRADFKDEDDFNEKLEPYFAKKADFDTKVLKALAIGQMAIEDGADAEADRFHTEAEARRIYNKAPSQNWFGRLLNLRPKPKTDANKAV